MSQTSFVLKGGGWYVSDYGYRKGIREEGEVPVKTAEEGGTASDPGKPADNSPESAGKSVDKPAKSAAEASATAPEKPATQSAGKSEAKQGTGAEKSASAP
jgi:hypothetical protein